MWVDPKRDGCRVFEGETGNTLPMSCYEGDDDDKAVSYTHLDVYKRQVY